MLDVQMYTDQTPAMALAARDFIIEQLTPEALSCYWLKALVAYSKMYYAATKDDVPSEISFQI